MAGDPPAYYCLYDHFPFDRHPERCPCIYHQVNGDLLLKHAHEAEWRDWSYVHWNHPDQLTRESIVDYFSTRQNWARIHDTWLERDQQEAKKVGLNMINLMAENERNRRELNYRAAFLGLPNREDYDQNWREWQAHIRELEELLDPKGALNRSRVVWRLLIANVKEAAGLYETFWDLEDARGSLVSRVRVDACRESSSPREVLGLSAITGGTVGGEEVDERCEKNLKDLRTNLRLMQTFRNRSKDDEAIISRVCTRPLPPPWVGGLTVSRGECKPMTEEDIVKHL